MEEIITSFFKVFIPMAFFTGIVGYGIFSMAEHNIKEREQQRADCIASGGKYAESQKANANPRDDYCIR
jgi:hypothetical protein